MLAARQKRCKARIKPLGAYQPAVYPHIEGVTLQGQVWKVLGALSKEHVFSEGALAEFETILATSAPAGSQPSSQPPFVGAPGDMNVDDGFLQHAYRCAAHLHGPENGMSALCRSCSAQCRCLLMGRPGASAWVGIVEGTPACV